MNTSLTSRFKTRIKEYHSVVQCNSIVETKVTVLGNQEYISTSDIILYSQRSSIVNSTYIKKFEAILEPTQWAFNILQLLVDKVLICLTCILHLHNQPIFLPFLLPCSSLSFTPFKSHIGLDILCLWWNKLTKSLCQKCVTQKKPTTRFLLFSEQRSTFVPAILI